MPSFAAFGNDLYTGKRSFDIVGRRRAWFAVATVLVAASILLLLTRGFNAGIEFTGGSQFTVSGASTRSTQPAVDAVASAAPTAGTPEVTNVGENGVRVQTERLPRDDNQAVAAALATAYGVSDGDVTSSYVGPSWGKDITTKAVRALVIFLVLAALVLAAYFRTWKMSAAAMIALLHDVLLTAGVYSLTGFEVTPAAVIGFLTILGYSLYDTVVVFDKVRENTAHVRSSTTRTFREAANLAVNQTLVRSINTSVVALLPVASILFVGAFLLGAGTLRDISLALFVGIIAGAYSSVFIATPLYSLLVEREPSVAAQQQRVLARRVAAPVPSPAEPAMAGAVATSGGDRTGASVVGSAPERSTTASPGRPTRGPRNQPARRPGGRRR